MGGIVKASIGANEHLLVHGIKAWVKTVTKRNTKISTLSHSMHSRIRDIMYMF